MGQDSRGKCPYIWRHPNSLRNSGVEIHCRISGLHSSVQKTSSILSATSTPAYDRQTDGPTDRQTATGIQLIPQCTRVLHMHRAAKIRSVVSYTVWCQIITTSCTLEALTLPVIEHWGTCPLTSISLIFMAALRSRCGHCIFVLWFLLSSSFFFPRLISAVGDWMSTILLHMVWP